jgi:hypothetical protein
LIFKIGFKNQIGFLFIFIFSFKIFDTYIKFKKGVGSCKYLEKYYPLDIQDDYHILVNEIHQFYYKQSIYKGMKLNVHKFILLKLTFIFFDITKCKRRVWTQQSGNFWKEAKSIVIRV